MVGLGPQRICAATPASAGCAVIDVLGTMSAAASPVIMVVVVEARKACGRRMVVGRREGRLEIELGERGLVWFVGVGKGEGGSTGRVVVLVL